MVAEVVFEDARFGTSADDLEGDDHEENEQEVGAIEAEDDSEDGDRAKNINGIADAGIEAVRDELAGFRRDGKRIAELDASDGPKKQTDADEDDTGDAGRSPRRGGVKIDEIGDGYCRDDGNHEGFHVHLGNRRGDDSANGAHGE